MCHKSTKQINMYKKPTLILIITFMISNMVAFSQKRYYREVGKSRILNEAEFINMKKALAGKFKNKFPDARTVETIKKQSMWGTDTLFDVQLKLLFDGTKSLSFFNHEGIYKKVDTPFPDFNLKSLDGKIYTLSDFKGKPMLINYWFKTCGPCKAEMPALNKIKEKYGDRVHFVAITYDDKNDVEQVLKAHPFNFLHLIEAKALIGELEINGAPKNIFVDKNGIIRQVYDNVDDVYDEATRSVLHGDGKEIMQMLDTLLNE